MNKLHLILIIFVSLLFIVSGVIVYNEILEPSYISYASACLNVDVEEYGYYQAGSYTQEESGNYTIMVSNAYPIEVQKEVLKHETVHFNQYQRQKVTCANLIFLEMEAYISQNLPDKIFYLFYDGIDKK